jgi:hypothetical protein
MNQPNPAVEAPLEAPVRPGAGASQLVERLRDWADEAYELQASELPQVRADMLQAADELERREAVLSAYFAAADACWAELCQEAAKRGITSVPVLPAQARALNTYSALREAFGPN